MSEPKSSPKFDLRLYREISVCGEFITWYTRTGYLLIFELEISVK